jgi:hypothetical protein
MKRLIVFVSILAFFFLGSAQINTATRADRVTLSRGANVTIIKGNRRAVQSKFWAQPRVRTVSSEDPQCMDYCLREANACYEACDMNPPGGRAICYNNCMWTQYMCEECYCRGVCG